MKEIIAKAKYNYGLCEYQVEKTTEKENISITIEDLNNDCELGRIVYKNISCEYLSPFLSWYNLIFCSNNYGPAPDYEYMHQAVQKGTKTAATIYLSCDSPEGIKVIKELPSTCGATPYGNNMIFVFRKGTLADYFDLNKIKEIYYMHGIDYLNWDKVNEYFNKPISFFGDENNCGFSLQSGGIKEEIVITGLVLGYPIESTIAFIK